MFFVLKIFGWVFKLIKLVLVVVIIGLIFFFWQSSQREKETAKNIAPATGAYIQAGDVNIFYQEVGPKTAQTVLLVHGTGAWSQLWEETLEALEADGIHAIAIDLPPFGFSDKPKGVHEYSREKQAARILAFIDALSLDQVTLVGHSVGARPSIEAALQSPSKISHLILVDPALGVGPDGQFQQNNPSFIMSSVFSVKMIRDVVFASYATNPLFTKSLFSSFVSKKDAVTQQRVEVLKQPLAIKDATTTNADWFEYLMTAQDNALSSDFKNFEQLTMPVSLIWGNADTITPLDQGKILQTLIPESSLTIMEDVGHIPYIEDSTKFNEILINLINAN